MKKFAFKLLSIICCLCFAFPCFTACGNKDDGEPKYKLEDYFENIKTNDNVQTLEEMQLSKYGQVGKTAFALIPITAVKITKITGRAMYYPSLYPTNSMDRELIDEYIELHGNYITTTLFDENYTIDLTSSTTLIIDFSITRELILDRTDDYRDSWGVMQNEDNNYFSFRISTNKYSNPNSISGTMELDACFAIADLKVCFKPIT